MIRLIYNKFCKEEGNIMKPIWKNGILWVWSDYYKSYIANYAPSHYWSFMRCEND